MKRLVLLPVAALVLAFAGTAQPASGDRGLFSSEPGPLGDHVQVAATNSPDGDSYCLDAPEPMAELTELVMWACHDVGRVADSQKFAFRESRTLALALLGGMELVHVATGQCVDVEASGGVGASVLLYRCTGNANQAWRWEDSQLVSLSHGVCLDIATGIQAMGPGTSAEVLMWTCRSADHEHGNYNQVFKTRPMVASAAAPAVPTQPQAIFRPELDLYEEDGYTTAAFNIERIEGAGVTRINGFIAASTACASVPILGSLCLAGDERGFTKDLATLQDRLATQPSRMVVVLDHHHGRGYIKVSPSSASQDRALDRVAGSNGFEFPALPIELYEGRDDRDRRPVNSVVVERRPWIAADLPVSDAARHIGLPVPLRLDNYETITLNLYQSATRGLSSLGPAFNATIQWAELANGQLLFVVAHDRFPSIEIISDQWRSSPGVPQGAWTTQTLYTSTEADTANALGEPIDFNTVFAGSTPD